MPRTIRRTMCVSIMPDVWTCLHTAHANIHAYTPTHPHAPTHTPARRQGRIHKHTTDFIESMISKGYLPLITKPTRVTTYSATLIDHLYSNATSQNYDSGIIISDVADHFGTFYASRKYSGKNLPTYTRTRQMKQVNISNFKQLLSSVLSDECPNSAYNTFLHIYI